jgi:hypothetical protein
MPLQIKQETNIAIGQMIQGYNLDPNNAQKLREQFVLDCPRSEININGVRVTEANAQKFLNDPKSRQLAVLLTQATDAPLEAFLTLEIFNAQASFVYKASDSTKHFHIYIADLQKDGTYDITIQNAVSYIRVNDDPENLYSLPNNEQQNLKLVLVFDPKKNSVAVKHIEIPDLHRFIDNNGNKLYFSANDNSSQIKKNNSFTLEFLSTFIEKILELLRRVFGQDSSSSVSKPVVNSNIHEKLTTTDPKQQPNEKPKPK